MSTLEILLLSVGLAMDAFAVSICKGLATKNVKLKHMCICGIWFGGFQALMPIIGFFVGSTLGSIVNKFAHWIAFALLLYIGINMIKEAKENEEADNSFAFKTMLMLAIATSIDALAVGVSLAFVGADIVISATCIGVITFIISAIGVKVGSVFGDKYKSKAEYAGGVILILIALKILLEGLGIL